MFDPKIRNVKENKLSLVVNRSLYWGKRVVLGFTLIAMVSTQAGATSFIKKTMENLANGTSLSNTTSAKSFHTATRGVISGGGVQVRTKIFNDNVINFVPPSFNASCNGLDIFLGSFSFINADELVQLFRSIASNALGFLFQLALDVVAPKIAQLMQKFADIVRELNKMVSDSCHMAQGLVTAARGDFSYFNKLSESTAALGGAVRNLGDSVQQFFGMGEGETAQSARGKQSKHFKDDAEKEGEIGNFMWNAMKKNISDGVNRSMASRLQELGLEHMEEIIMSLTGYYVATETTPSTTAGHGATVSEKEIQGRHGKELDIKALIEGSEHHDFVQYECDDRSAGENAKCLYPKPQKQSNVEGLAQLMYKGLCGTTDLNAICTDNSVLNKLASNNNGNNSNLSALEMAAVFSLPPHYRSQITDLQILSAAQSKAGLEQTEGGALVQKHIRLLALSSVVTMVNEIYSEIREQVEAYTGSSKEMLLKLIEDSRNEFYQEVNQLKQDKDYGSIDVIYSDVNNALQRFKDIPMLSVPVPNSNVGSGSKE
ncbi:conjugal transfer protein TraH [Succinivibrio dextrinosolvens]|uniref:conjugal transfer protein TraH n=1 Tax=Succinivibrio dextrinosolvens TaxID=83771 RepID=UPI00241DB76A|nr:conjugal transfer protein TraH [Succinivibrio dextrinosolvens]MBE6423127.1 hypothetical protein [Succinivibrio dextrinosolvens]